MKTVNLTINNLQLSVNEGNTILDAAEKSGIIIPALCHIKGFKPYTSCMICQVHEIKTDSLIPACSMPVVEGMQIETDNNRVRIARKDTLDLLLSEHAGDCRAPCQRACPADMDIPLMIRQIKQGDLKNAIITVKNNIALPAVLGRICSAPCENGCNRKYYDSPVSICLLKRFAADKNLADKTSDYHSVNPKSGKNIAVIGSGPAGLSAAYYITRYGHKCCIFESNTKPGGMLQYGVPEEKLPKSVLNSEIDSILDSGVELRLNEALGKNFSLSELRKNYDAVVLTFGKTGPDLFKNSEIELSSRGIVINRRTFETSVPGVFAGGNSISERRMAVRAAAHGRFIADSVHQYLRGMTVSGYPKRFNSKLGKLQEGETGEFIKETETFNRIVPANILDGGFSRTEAEKESGRCFHCDCRKLKSCKLRQYSEKYGAEQKRFKSGKRKRFHKNIQHDLIIFEQGKCIKCSKCVRITKKAGEKYGFTFINRGFDVQLTVPFNESLNDGLQKMAGECEAACPTGAIALRNDEE